MEMQRIMSLYRKGEPYLVKLAAGEGAKICSCGQTASPPFCDDSHMRCDGRHRPFVLAPAGFPQHVWVCGCGRSRAMPYCDGSHKAVQEQKAS